MAQINLQNDYLSVRFDNFPFSHETEKFSSFLILTGSLIKNGQFQEELAGKYATGLVERIAPIRLRPGCRSVKQIYKQAR